MQNGHMTMVSRFVKINKELVRVQGREGITPLLYASQIGEVELIANFLFACPDSIEDVTARDETALHIAVKNEQFESLQVLVGWLKANYKKGARKLEFKILNQKDDAGNTILHISALGREPQVTLCNYMKSLVFFIYLFLIIFWCCVIFL
jgi:ankyrin repeat protein